MMNNFDCLDATLALLKGMESTVLGLQQLRGYVVGGVGQEILGDLIQEAETRLAEVKHRIIQ